MSECSALKALECYDNKLNAEKMKELLLALPTRDAGTNAEAKLYIEKTNVIEGNYKDFTSSAELKAAFDGAKGRNWMLKKQKKSGLWGNI